MEILKDLREKVKLLFSKKRVCAAPGCGALFDPPGYEILGRRYCCEKCSPALYRKVVALRKAERALESGVSDARS